MSGERMKRLSVLPLLLLLAALALAAGAGSGSAAKAKAGRLHAFGSCGELLGYVKGRALPLVGAYGLGGGPVAIAMPSVGQERASGAAPPQASAGSGGAIPGVDFSETNVQEAGVDEPDIVKTDGSHLYVVNGDTLRVLDVGTGRPRSVGSLKLPAGAGHELLLRGNRLLVLSRAGYYWAQPMPGAARMIMPAPSQPGSTLSEVDVSDPGSPRVVRTLTFEADYVSARLVGQAARIVLSSALPRPIDFVQPKEQDSTAVSAAAARNRAIVRGTGLKSWLPRYTLARKGAKKATSGALVQCRNVRRPASFSGLGMLTVLTVDLDKGLEPVDSDAVLADGRIVYASRDSLYVATERWVDRPVTAGAEAGADGVTTAIHMFDISDPERTHYRASGEVTGVLLNQWSLSEHGGALRVASTDTPRWWNPGERRESESYVTVLRQNGGTLSPVGRVGGLGKGERIYAVRFMGDTGYVVTFRQVDPLYTLDLSNPERPAVLGELKIPGFSSYLHPIGDDVILGVGQDATEDGRVVGSQLSIFDVSNLRKPTRLYQATLGRGNSEAEYDHHAFLYWPQTRLAVIPLQTHPDEKGAGELFSGAVGYTVGRTRGIERLGKVSHPTAGSGPSARIASPGTPIRRSLVVRGTLYTVSDAGVLASSLTSLTELGWAPFPQPPAQGGVAPGVPTP
jgi:hypothetical protein